MTDEQTMHDEKGKTDYKIVHNVSTMQHAFKTVERCNSFYCDIAVLICTQYHFQNVQINQRKNGIICISKHRIKSETTFITFTERCSYFLNHEHIC